jgi:hypothetical protein
MNCPVCLQYGKTCEGTQQEQVKCFEDICHEMELLQEFEREFKSTQKEY